MLSIGKLSAGQASYYLEQAQGSVTHAGAVSSGVEDYYLSGPEVSGTWEGSGAVVLGLRGTVDAQALDRVLAGEHVATGEPLGRVLAARVPGFDLTFSAPKSVSVLFGVGGSELRGAIRDAHDAAVREALGYMERAAAMTRRGPGGVHAIAGNGLVAAAFRHRTSRAGDPQLHTHVLVANLTLGADGQWSTLDGRRIYAHAKTAGFLYETRLRNLLTRELGVEWGPVRNGIADIDGVPAGVLRAFSRRRADIDAELERRGATSAAAAQVAALQTRRVKDYRVTPEQLQPEWRRRAASLGFSAEQIRGLLGRAMVSELGQALEREIAEALVGADGLTRDRATFTRRAVIQMFSERLPADAGLTIVEIEAAVDRFLASDRAVALAVGERGLSRSDVLWGRDGRVVPLVRGERVYSTPELLQLEQHILQHATSTQNGSIGVARERMVERALSKRPTLSGEQAEMVRRLTLEGDGVAVVVGQAGAGKTFALAAATEAWKASGRVVVGAAVARRAARNLEQSTGIASTSLAALFAELDHRPAGLPRRAVVVIDEASMVSTRQLARLVAHTSRVQAKLVLLGDHRQLPSIEAGGAFRALITRLPVIELRENRRQAERWEREALVLLRDGRGADALREYEARGRVVAGEDADALRQKLVADWWAARDPDRSVMIAHRRVDVRDLNGRARALLRVSGALGRDELTVGPAAFAVGDRVVLRRNDRRLGISNGDRGVVTRVDVTARSIDIALGSQQVRLPADYLDSPTRHGAALQHAYAITGHVAQGLTFRQTFVLASDRISSEWAYSALSRGRESNRLYAISERDRERDEYAPAERAGGGTRDRLATAVERSEAHELASDTGREERLVGELQRAHAELDAASSERDAAAGRHTELEDVAPHPLRRGARRQHQQALTRARDTEERAAARVAACRDRVNAVLAELQRVRRVESRRQEPQRAPRLERPERVLDRAAGAGWEIGR